MQKLMEMFDERALAMKAEATLEKEQITSKHDADMKEYESIMCMYIHVCIYMYMYVCIYVCMYICMYVCICIRMYMCMYVYVYVYICICVCISINE